MNTISSRLSDTIESFLSLTSPEQFNSPQEEITEPSTTSSKQSDNETHHANEAQTHEEIRTQHSSATVEFLSDPISQLKESINKQRQISKFQ